MHRRFVVGSVPYVNARPLVDSFESDPDAFPVDIVYDVPSKLPAMLDSGRADAVLASSIEALLSQRRVAAGLCIASHGPVQSVRLFSRVPFEQIRSIALDTSSLTSNALAQILLAEQIGVRPSCLHAPPDLEKMLDANDACVLIGDIGLRTDGEGLHVLDLGQAWTELTGLPFVWALWMGGSSLSTELSSYLSAARRRSQLGAGRVVDDAEMQAEQIRRISLASSWTFDEVREYLAETIIFDMGAAEIEGLREFSRKLAALGIKAPYFPELVEPDVVVATTAFR